ncbi:50S ribosomal protein L10 [Verrucomicrobiota bacterium]|jgi:large subunit ribosomal protein L10|nr:50S ribosomal protein L10 [Verrucomicrobiota bacterium]
MHPAKAFIVNDLNKRLNDSPFIFVADYTGLNVIQFSELRNRLDKAGARCSVVKNSYLRLAAKGAGLPDLGELRGQNAIVTGDKDVAAAAKVLKNFTAEFKKPTIRTGVVDRLIVSSEQIQVIADLPSRDVLLSQLLGVLQAPASTLVRLLNEPASQLARVLQAKADQGGGAAAAPAEVTAEKAETPAPAEAAATPATETANS